MLSVKQNRARQVLDLGGLWNFQLDQEDLSEKDRFPGLLKDADLIAVPASYNDQKDCPEYRDHYGKAYYQRSVEVPLKLQGQRLWLRFAAVAHRATVWINEECILQHRGGFLPFEAEITERVRPGERVLLTVSADNRLNRSTLPVGNNPDEAAFFGSDNAGIPSVEQAKKEQKLQNRPNFDFFNYAGIFRPVTLYTTPKNYIKDITLVSRLNGEVDFEILYEGEEPPSLEILDADREIAARAEGANGRFKIPDPKLWEPYPGTPYLYTARVRLPSGDTEDLYEEPFGIRTVEVKGREFLINGKPFYFKGFGKHEDSFFRGRGLDLCLNVKDVNLIHWLGANSFRTSHYPYAEEMYELCDRAGIVIIDETPAVGLNMGGSGNPYAFGTSAHHRQVIKDLIQRDKNHPSVVMWSLGNEADLEHYPEEAYAYWRPLYELAHEADPQDRPVTLVCNQNDYTKDITTRTMDVICLNRYYGWYNLGGDLDAAVNGWKIELAFWEKTAKPIMLTEYGADAVAGLHRVVPEMFSEEFQAAYYERLNLLFDDYPFIVGEQIWNFADFNTFQGPGRRQPQRHLHPGPPSEAGRTPSAPALAGHPEFRL